MQSLTKIDRVVYISLKLLLGKKVNVKETAAELKITPRSVNRYIVVIEKSGLPIVSENPGFYSLVENTPFTIFGQHTSIINLQIFIADILCRLGNFFETSLQKTINRALKSETSSPFYLKLPEVREKLPVSSTLILLIEAINKKLIIDFRYSDKKQYRVMPLKVACFEGFWYLISTKKSCGEIHKFLISELYGVKISGEKFISFNADRLELILDASANIWFGAESEKTELILKADKYAAQYYKKHNYLPEQKVIKEYKNGQIIISSFYSHEKEVLPEIQSWIPHVKILEPESLAKKMESVLKKYLKKV